jgi:hypothetical protein
LKFPIGTVTKDRNWHKYVAAARHQHCSTGNMFLRHDSLHDAVEISTGPGSRQ